MYFKWIKTLLLTLLGSKPTFKTFFYNSRRSIGIDRESIPKYHFVSTCSQSKQSDN